VLPAAPGKESQQEADEQENYVRDKEYGGVIARVDFHNGISSPSVSEGEDAKENVGNGLEGCYSPFSISGFLK
jgi:hypothetical protein